MVELLRADMSRILTDIRSYFFDIVRKLPEGKSEVGFSSGGYPI